MKADAAHDARVVRRSNSGGARARDQARRIGDEVRLARVSCALTVKDVARRAGVSWSTASRIEMGDPGVSIRTLCAVTEAVALDIVVRAYPGRSLSLRDTGQLEIAERLCRLPDSSWQPALELAVGDHGEAIDAVFFGAREIVAAEIERLATDWQAQYRRADQKRRTLAARHARPVRLVMVVEDTRRNRAALWPHLAVIRTALPAGSREVMAAFKSGRPIERDGLLWVRRGRL